MNLLRPPRRLYYGWVLVLVLSLTEPVSWGVQYYALSVFLQPMEADLGWSRSAMTGAFSAALLVSGIAAVPMGRWLDRRGPRLLMTAGSGAAALLVLAWSRVHDLRAFYLIWAAIGVTMAATFYEPAFVAVANWFVRGRGRALTVLTFGGGFASVVFIPLSDWLVRSYGWRTALVVLAAILAAATIPPHALFLRRRPADLGLRPDGTAATDDGGPSRAGRGLERSVSMRAAVRRAAFWWLTGAFFLVMLANVATTVHLIPFLTERGFSPGFAAAAAGLIGLMALPGRLIFTPLGGRVSRRLVTAGIFALQSVGLVLLLLAHSRGAVWLFVVLFGAGFGAITPARAALLAEFYGPAAYGTISGLLALFLTGARAVAPVGVSLVHDRAGGYDPAFWALAAVSAMAAVAILLADGGAGRRTARLGWRSS